MRFNLQTEIGRLRLLALLEGISYLLILFITVPMKYWLHSPMPNKVVGMAHGLLFILYILAVIKGKFTFGWDVKTTFRALLASIIPFGTFWADAKIFVKHDQL